MKAIEIYNLKPKTITKDIYCLNGFYYNHVPEIDFSNIDYDLNKKIEIKYYVDYCFDGRRTWKLASVWYDDKPVMIIQNAGREGDDHHERFITDKNLYFDIIKYLQSLIISEEIEEELDDLIDEGIEIDNLTNFYGHCLNEFYDNNFKPNYNVGEIIKIMTPKENPRGFIFDDTEMIEVDAEIIDIYDNPFDCYRVKEVNRLMKWGDLKDGENRIIEKSKATSEQLKEYHDIWLRLNKNLEVLDS